MTVTGTKNSGLARRSAGWILIIVGLLAAFYVGQNVSDPGSGIVAMMLSLAILGYGMHLLLQGRKLGQATADDVRERDHRPPVVFLRAFASEPEGLDDIFGFTKRYQLLPDVFGLYQGGTGQSRFAEDINRIGPFIALGRPGERFPAFGAARKYVPDEQWKPTIKKWISSAAVIVIWARPPRRPGGFDWEMREIVSLNRPGRILIICPARQSEYLAFKEQADRIFPMALPREPPASWLLTFHGDWRPRPLKIDHKEARPSLISALRPMLDDLRIPVSA
jgi:hypothetical protein